MSGLPRLYSAGTVDQWPKNLSCALLFGGMWAFPVPDLDRTDYLLMLGANPHASQGSLLAAPDVLGAARRDPRARRPRRGGRPAPHRHRGSRDEWLAIRPGTDAAFLLAIAHVLFAEGRVRPGRLAAFVNGVEEVRRAVPRLHARARGGDLRHPGRDDPPLARELSDAPRAAVYGRIGTCNQEFGTLASWLVDVLNVLTGNLDREGGAMFSNPIAWSLATLTPPEFANGFAFHRWRTRVRGAPEVLGQVPLSCMAEEIATPGQGQIRALITIAGNPVLSAPDAAKLDAALPALECMVSVDNWLNETTRHADVILPGSSALEQPHYDELIWGWAVRNAGKYSPALFDPGERPAEWEILLELAAILQGQKAADAIVAALDQLFFAGLVAAIAQLRARASRAAIRARSSRRPERPAPSACSTSRSAPARGATRYGANPAGSRSRSCRRSRTASTWGRSRRACRVCSRRVGQARARAALHHGDVARLRARLARRDDGLVLVSRRHVRSNNSWMHNVPSLVTGKDRCTLLVHPDDARAAGLADGKRARITSQAGSIVAPVEVSDEMRPGVVCLPHGWGHDKPGTRLSVASQHAGVCNNALAPGELVDVLSGNAIVNGIPVEVSPGVNGGFHPPYDYGEIM